MSARDHHPDDSGRDSDSMTGSGDSVHNPDAITFHGLNYSHFRGRQIRTHNAVYHEYDDVPALHIPVELDGVIP